MRISPVFETLIWLSPPNEKVDICAAATLVNQPPTFTPSFLIFTLPFSIRATSVVVPPMKPVTAEWTKRCSPV